VLLPVLLLLLLSSSPPAPPAAVDLLLPGAAAAAATVFCRNCAVAGSPFGLITTGTLLQQLCCCRH
jgi:hypothetical protein